MKKQVGCHRSVVWLAGGLALVSLATACSPFQVATPEAPPVVAAKTPEATKPAEDSPKPVAPAVAVEPAEPVAHSINPSPGKAAAIMAVKLLLEE